MKELKGVTAELIPPQGDKGWSLQFFNVPQSGIRDFIWSTCRHYGTSFKVRPFLQGNSEDWMMIEFFSPSEPYILEASMNTCKKLDIPLEV